MRVPLPTNQMQATYEDRNVAARIDEVRKAHPDIYLNLIDTHAGAFNRYVSYRFPIVRPLFEIKSNRRGTSARKHACHLAGKRARLSFAVASPAAAAS
jgi:hypothetical protein